jgi:predicted RNA binding protein YcfA (HicA-like mRNA interferase family)
VKQVSGRELAQIIQRRGWTLARIQGSHHVFTMAGRRERIVIPDPWKSAPEKGIASLTHEDRQAARGRSVEARETQGKGRAKRSAAYVHTSAGQGRQKRELSFVGIS